MIDIESRSSFSDEIDPRRRRRNSSVGNRSHGVVIVDMTNGVIGCLNSYDAIVGTSIPVDLSRGGATNDGWNRIWLRRGWRRIWLRRRLLRRLRRRWSRNLSSRRPKCGMGASSLATVTPRQAAASILLGVPTTGGLDANKGGNRSEITALLAGDGRLTAVVAVAGLTKLGPFHFK